MFNDRDIEQVNFVFCCRDNFLSSKMFFKHQQQFHCDDLIYQKEKKGIKTRSL